MSLNLSQFKAVVTRGFGKILSTLIRLTHAIVSTVKTCKGLVRLHGYMNKFLATVNQ